MGRSSCARLLAVVETETWTVDAVAALTVTLAGTEHVDF